MYRNSRILLLFAIFGLAFSIPTDWSQLDEECFAESGVDAAQYELFLKNPDIDHFFDDNKSCYYLCLGKKSGEVNADGSFNLQAILKPDSDDVMSPLLREILIKCSNGTGKNPCDSLAKNIGCMFHSMTPRKDENLEQTSDNDDDDDDDDDDLE